MMNEVLKTNLAGNADAPVTEGVLRRVIREDLPAARRVARSTESRAKSVRPR